MFALVLYFLQHSALRYVTHMQPESYGYFWPKRAWLWLHLGGGFLVLLLGPFQFVRRLRQSHPRLHRWSGRIYLFALLVACVGAAGLFATTPLGWTTGVAFAVMTWAWLLTGVVAWLAILRRDVATHRSWMLRNYIITFAFITFRMVTRIPGVFDLGTNQELFTTFVWASWVVPLLGHEVIASLCTLYRASPQRSSLFMAIGNSSP